ncbi:hypothetical protein [Eilatimonas milleporae]|uniref:MYXO-CTERM domain-containing protein n=1 Tax=Eilatimonas milleporae TaxID=911205 RepID=A0A3M0CJ53_9PROT|nr:hypothetical protein [Eilatimonas milleporae]RMB08440.1 hypothetical protein BXY39_1073 [Eilatimonas milleporae]
MRVFQTVLSCGLLAAFASPVSAHIDGTAHSHSYDWVTVVALAASAVCLVILLRRRVKRIVGPSDHRRHDRP